MRRLAALATAGMALAIGALASATPATAASDSATAVAPVNETDQLEAHSRVDCNAATAHCEFVAGVRLLTPEGVTGFPKDAWVRQSIEVRSQKRSVYLDVHTYGGEKQGEFGDRGGPNTKVFKEPVGAVIQAMYRNEGPPEKYQTAGDIYAADQATGQPKTDANVIVCTHAQVVYPGVNHLTPATCAQTTFT
jgi:hypothetical protein